MSCCWTPPNGFVDFGLLFELFVEPVISPVVGIKFSKLTNDEFSPRKLSGVLRVLFVSKLFVVLSFHGFVFEGAVVVVLPKKSPNGSLTGADGAAGDGEVTRLFENSSNSSKSFDDGFCIGIWGVLAAHGSVICGVFHGFVVCVCNGGIVDCIGFIDHKSFVFVDDHGSTICVCFVVVVIGAPPHGSLFWSFDHGSFDFDEKPEARSSNFRERERLKGFK